MIQVFDRAAGSTRVLVALSMAGEAERLALLAYERSIRNLGYGLGGLCASVALAVDSRLAFVVVLLLNAVTYGFGALLLSRMSPAPPARSSGDGDVGYRTALRDRPYVGLALLTGVLWLNDSVLRIALPLWIVRRTALSPSFSGIFFAVNTALVASLQVRVSRGSTEARGAARAYQRAAMALVTSCAFFAAAPLVVAPVAALVMTFAVTALTLGEVFGSAAQWGASIFSTSISVQTAFGPALITFALVQGGDWGWVGLGCLFLSAGLGASQLALFAATKRDERDRCRHRRPQTAGGA